MPYLLSVLRNKCPRCREGDLFVSKIAYDLKNNVKMYQNCPVCGQPTEIEVGFYYGTSYVSYALGVALSVALFVAWWVILGFSISDNSLFYYLGVNAVMLILMQPSLMRLSRSLWLSWFVKYDPNWKEKGLDTFERINKDHANNW